MVKIDMMDYMMRIERAKSIPDIQSELISDMLTLGVERFYYISIPPNSFFDRNNIVLTQHGYDKIPGFIQDFQTYLTSEEANVYFNFHRNGGTRARKALSPEPNPNLKNLYAMLLRYKNHLNIGAALTVPVYGPLGHYGFFYVPVTGIEDTQELRLMLEFLCHNAHYKSVELILKPAKFIKLSRREKQVLTELVRGKNNASIAKDLNISKHTVDEYVRRIFAKLDVNDRVTASIKATKLFLLREDMPRGTKELHTTSSSGKNHAA